MVVVFDFDQKLTAVLEYDSKIGYLERACLTGVR